MVEDPEIVWIGGQVNKIEGEDIVVITLDGKGEENWRSYLYFIVHMDGCLLMKDNFS